MTELATIGFHNTDISVLTDGQGDWIFPGQICRNMGLDANGQKQSIERSHWSEGWTCVTHVQLPGDAQARPQFALHARRFAMWMATVTTSRIKDESVRALVEQYQTGAADVLADWLAKKAAPAKLALPTQAEALRGWADALDAQQAAERQAAILDAHNRSLKAAKRELTAEVEEARPKVRQADHIRSADGMCTIGDFANKLNDWAMHNLGLTLKHQDVWNYVGHLEIIIRSETGRRNHPTAFGTKNGYVKSRETIVPGSNGPKVSVSPRLTPKGEGYVWDRATAQLTAHRTLKVGRFAEA